MENYRPASPAFLERLILLGILGISVEAIGRAFGSAAGDALALLGVGMVFGGSMYFFAQLVIWLMGRGRR